MLNHIGFSVSPQIRNCITQSVYDAVGDLIKEDVRRYRLRTRNGNAGRVWDFLNTSLCESLDSPDCMTYVVNRGPWEMVIVYEKKTKWIYTIMREARFASIRHNTPKRRRMHYLDMFTRHFNRDLLASIGQIHMFTKEFSDESELSELVGKMLYALRVDGAVIDRHVLVLFDSRNHQLTSIRAVMIDSNLDIVAEENWTSSIPSTDSVIVETEDHMGNTAKDPNHGLRLTSKAAARKKEKLRIRKQEIDKADEM